jgi:hypothetical protein
MPAIFDSLMKHQHLTAHVAWRVSFIVPFIIITALAMGILFTTEDCPSGKWADRHQPLDNIVLDAAVDSSSQEKIPTEKSETKDTEAAEHEPTAIDKAEGEVIVAPTLKEGLQVFFSLQTIALAAPYACSFGTYSPSPLIPFSHLPHTQTNPNSRRRTRNQLHYRNLLPKELPQARPNRFRPLGSNVRLVERRLPPSRRCHR